MKLVVSFSIGDGCTYSCDHVFPVEYESEEALLVDISDAIALARKENRTLNLFDANWNWRDFGYLDHRDGQWKPLGVDVQTMENWFESSKVPAIGELS